MDGARGFLCAGARLHSAVRCVSCFASWRCSVKLDTFFFFFFFGHVDLTYPGFLIARILGRAEGGGFLFPHR